jgi:glycosyltransferase involved in cell wall biosynthesis
VVVTSLHVITSTARRGAETFAVDLATALCQLGDQAEVVALHSHDGGSGHEVEILGPARRDRHTLAGVRQRARSFDVVVAHGSSTLEACALALAGTGVPFVYRTIGDPSYWVPTRGRRRWAQLLHRRAARHVALWPGAREQLAEKYGLDRGRIDVIPNGVPLERFPVASPTQRAEARRRLGVDTARTCLAFVGALSPEKNVGTAIEAAQGLPGAVLLIAGDGPDRERWEGLGGGSTELEVAWLGSLADPWPVYAAADLLLLPSHSEGMPAAIIEAGLTGTASVATKVGAVPELVQHQETGWLVDAGDSAAFCQAVISAMDEAALLGEQASMAFGANYGMGSVAEQWARSLFMTRREGRGHG